MRDRAVEMRLCRYALSILAFLPCIFCTQAIAGDSPAAKEHVALPRYRLEVGQELVYQQTALDDLRVSNDTKNKKGNAAQGEMEWRIVKEEEWMLRSMKTRAEFFAAVPRFTTAWEAKIVDGSMFRLADQRGKILVLYFWTMDCEYNILAAPQICQLAAGYQGKKEVAVVGMFVRESANDREARAGNLIAKCLPGFPHLEAKNVAALYGFQQYGMGCPTILVLDQAGRVHEVQNGYSADMAQHIRKIVDDLRSKPTAESK